jgi:anti-sigma factor RsiW
MNNDHEALPWYINGTLGAAEAATFERHLESCTACRAEAGVLRAMQSELQGHGEDLLGEHPAPEQLVAFLDTEAGEPELTAAAAAGIRRHLALCDSCSQETRWVSGAVPAVVPQTRQGVPLWAGLAAGLLAAALQWPLLTGRESMPVPTGLVQMQLVEPVQRSAAAAQVLVAPPGAASVHILLPVELPATGQAFLTLRQVDGGVVIPARLIDAADLYQNAFLLLACSRAECPDGNYVARVGESATGGLATEYRFSLQTGS